MVRYGQLDAADPTWLFVLVKVNHLLLTLNSAGNIVIYSLKVPAQLIFSIYQQIEPSVAVPDKHVVMFCPCLFSPSDNFDTSLALLTR